MLRSQAGGVNRRLAGTGGHSRFSGRTLQLPFAVRISRGMLALCSLLVLAATCSLTLISWRVDDVNRRLEEVEVTHAALREENVKLLTQRAKLSSRDHVVQQASRRLGLQLPRPDQVRRL